VSRAKTLGRDGTLFNSTGKPPVTKIPSNNRVYPFVQEINGSPFLSNAALPQGIAYAFRLSDIPQASSFEAIFDQYRISAIECWLIPRTTSLAGASANAGLLATVVDYDDNSSTTVLNDLLQYSNVVVGSGLDGHYRHFVPHIAMGAYSGAFTSFANVEKQWIDCGSPGVYHYGIKVVWTVTDSVYTLDSMFRLHFEFRNVR